MSKIIKYKVSSSSITVTDAEYDLVKYMYAENMVSCIKFMRGQYDLSLAESRRVCESICGLILPRLESNKLSYVQIESLNNIFHEQDLSWPQSVSLVGAIEKLFCNTTA